jgi:hypothetical protein
MWMKCIININEYNTFIILNDFENARVREHVKQLRLIACIELCVTVGNVQRRIEGMKRFHCFRTHYKYTLNAANRQI